MPLIDEANLQTCYLGSVNAWECDENDHLNVRFYTQKMNQALQIFVRQFSEPPAVNPDGVLQGIRAQHIRYLREARTAMPLRIDCAIVGQRVDQLDVLKLMVDATCGEVPATYLTTIAVSHRLNSDYPLLPIPEVAAPRGLEPDTPYDGSITAEEASKLGYIVAGKGLIGRDECDASNVLLPHNYIGRISDGVPNVWAWLNKDEENRALPCKQIGSVAIEYRLSIHRVLQAGSAFTQLSSLRVIGSKTYLIVHRLIDDTSGHCAATAEVVAVLMDLSTRRATPISEQHRRRIESMLSGSIQSGEPAASPKAPHD